MNLIYYKSVILTLFSIFPFLLISGPFLSDIFCITLGLIYIFYNFKTKNWRDFFNIYKIYIYFFLFFYIYININSFFSFDSKISFLSSIPFFRIILYIFAIALFFSKFKVLYKIFYLSFLVALTILFIDSVFQFYFDKNILGLKIVVSNRISSFFGDELIMGSYVSRLLPISLACSFMLNLDKKYLINILLIFFSGVLIALSGERLAAFYYLGTILIYFLLVRKYFLNFFIIMMISIFSLNFYKPLIIERFYNNTINQMNQTGSVFSYRHTLHYKTAYEMYLDKKFFGHGLKSFRNICSEEKYQNSIQLKQLLDKKIQNEENNQVNYITEYMNGCNTHPHNIFLELLSELGIIGVFFLIITYIYTCLNFLKSFVQNFLIKNLKQFYIAKSLVLGGVILQLFPLVPSGSFFNNYMMIIFYFSVGFYLSLLND